MIATVAVGTDGSETAGRAVDAALALAERYGAKVVFISAYKRSSESRLRLGKREAPTQHHWRRSLTEAVDGVLRAAEQKAQERGLKWASEAGLGDPADVLVELAEKHKADLLIVGNKGMHRRVLGSIPNSVSHKASCNVLIVKTT